MAFLRENFRWLAAGFLLFFFSGFGQTFFIALSASDVRAALDLTPGDYGGLYAAATLLSAATLTRVGGALDRFPPRRSAMVVLPALALAAASMALVQHVAQLFLSLFLLRLLGQGMMSNLAFTAIGRWFSARRGRAFGLTTPGLNAAEALMPLLFLTAVAWVGWRGAWALGGAVILLAATPLLLWALKIDRAPLAPPSDAPGPDAWTSASPRPPAEDWTRARVLRDPLFYRVKLAMLPPAFIGNAVFFHQAYLVELRGWDLETIAAAFPLMAGATVLFTLVSGQLVDRFSARALLPVYLLPMGLGCLILGGVSAPWSAVAFLALFGVSNGFSLTMFGALWPEIYGVRRLGELRALMVAALVFISAVGPGLTGLLIDLGVALPVQIMAMGAYCLVVSALMLPIPRLLAARADAS